MKVKIGDKIYDGENEPVMVILTDEDKKNIAGMASAHDRYCVFPDGLMGEEELVNFMDLPRKQAASVGYDLSEQFASRK